MKYLKLSGGLFGANRNRFALNMLVESEGEKFPKTNEEN